MPGPCGPSGLNSDPGLLWEEMKGDVKSCSWSSIGLVHGFLRICPVHKHRAYLCGRHHFLVFVYSIPFAQLIKYG